MSSTGNLPAVDSDCTLMVSYYEAVNELLESVANKSEAEAILVLFGIIFYQGVSNAISFL